MNCGSFFTFFFFVFWYSHYWQSHGTQYHRASRDGICTAINIVSTCLLACWLVGWLVGLSNNKKKNLFCLFSFLFWCQSIQVFFFQQQNEIVFDCVFEKQKNKKENKKQTHLFLSINHKSNQIKSNQMTFLIVTAR